MDSKPVDQNASTSNSPATDSTRAPLVIATLLQLGFTLRYAWAYWELVRTGSTSLLTALISLLSCILLYNSVIRHLAGKSAQWGLVVVTVGLVWSFLKWGPGNLWSYPFLFGAIVGTVTWALSLKASKRA
ncbi:hypothetical protein PQH03_20935 [Ralstonia insidiosa]|jgi:hypothetical protein|uniref:hypothetical protein n=2 Tax=Pseudomonadota TaxID=1224 RepID=UPI0006649E28|nr:hypothetical protein [Ralstonia insidiosa]KMW44082.1 hypothetical protein AC240_27065 [Ralstonia sp. MD27]MBX3771631.1 hypothetical protein [Ralstonia pickettii]NOZ14904.1 hypothetical protein [Betaproteobacteria bacterium]MBA9858607.1 hypothetical protein [Ralstonia insidiosa]MBA9871735.1 hypothetical protein [Ralstonia insidiosa]